MDTPFYKRTEFYLALAALVFGGLLGSGLIGPGTIAAKLIGMIIEALAVLGYTVGRTIAKLGIVDGKPGYMTTEFWGSIGAGGLILFQSLQLIPDGSPLQGIIAALLSVLPSVGYSVSRGKVKAGLLSLLFLCCIGAPLSGCAGWATHARQSLVDAHASMKATSATGEKLIGDQCRSIAEHCRDDRRAAEKAGDAAKIEEALACAPLITCHAELHEFNALLIDGQLSLIEGQAAIGLGEEVAKKDMSGILEKVRAAIAKARLILNKAEAL